MVTLLCMIGKVTAQDLNAYKWKNRILFVMANNKDSEKLQQQIAVFNQNVAGLKERNLVIYLVTPYEFAKYNAQTIDWKKSKGFFDAYKLKDTEMELILFGMDGQIKHRKYNVTSAIEIFVIIDGMPLRQSELKNNNQN